MPMIRMALLFLLIYTGSAGCGTTGAYLRDRGDDFMDVFTVSAEYPVFGAQAAVGPAAVGFYTPVTVTSSFILPRLEDRGHGIGLRGGWGCYTFAGHSFIVGLQESFQREDCAVPGKTGKNLSRHKSWCLNGDKLSDIPPSVYTQADISAGCCLGGRLGFNPGELVDFILGFSTLDIYRDDVNVLRYRFCQALNQGDVAALRKFPRGAELTMLPDKEGRLPLHRALLMGQEAMALHLIPRSDPHHPDIYGMTPLHYAVMAGNEKAVKRLMEYRVDVNAPIRKAYKNFPPGSRPLDVAVLVKAERLARLLQEFGAFHGTQGRLVNGLRGYCAKGNCDTGQGTMVFEIAVYQGGFLRGSYHGKGELKRRAFGKLSLHYRGEFLEGLFHGKGKLILYDYDKTTEYAGQWARGKRQGAGVETVLYKKDTSHPQAWRGILFRGQWREDLRHGPGVEYWIMKGGRKKVRQKGRWFWGKMDTGLGYRQYGSGEIYYGPVKNGMPEGRGVLAMGNCVTFRGHFFHGQKHGSGTECGCDGRVKRAGRWVRDVYQER